MASLPEHLTRAPVGRDRLPREVMEEHQRARVVEAAISVFAKRGYPGTTVDHLVGAASMGVGSFYSLIGGKEECFLLVLRTILADARDRIEAALPADGTPPEKVAAGLRAALETIAADPLRARVALVESQSAGARPLRMQRETVSELAPGLRACRAASPIGEELPPTLEDASLHGVIWFLQQRVADGEADRVTESMEDLAQIVIEPYVGAEETARLVAEARATGAAR